MHSTTNDGEQAPAPHDPPRDAPGAPPGAGRHTIDRRERPTVRLSRWSLLGGRRHEPRRAAEIENSFVDVYGHGLLLAVLWIALMNAADSFFTIVHLQNGGTEVNPIAEVLLQSGRSTFVLVKEAVISLALLVLCLHKNFHLARLGLWTAAVAYTGLLAYHLLLFLV
jgi:hypothetical protein